MIRISDENKLDKEMVDLVSNIAKFIEATDNLEEIKEKNAYS